MKNKIVNIIGAGGHTRSLISLIEHNSLLIDGIYDDSFVIEKNEIINGYPVKGSIDQIDPEVSVILSFGESLKRFKMYQDFEKQVYIENLIHPSKIIEKFVSLGNSNQIFAGTIINSNASIGDNNIINTGAIIEHEAIIGSHNHISVGAKICGRVRVGSWCYIGAGSTIIDKIRIDDNVIVGANTVVIDNITKPGTYVGNPARRVK